MADQSRSQHTNGGSDQTQLEKTPGQAHGVKDDPLQVRAACQLFVDQQDVDEGEGHEAEAVSASAELHIRRRYHSQLGLQEPLNVLLDSARVRVDLDEVVIT